MSDFIPDDYQSWRDCITRICGIPLTERYIKQRIKALNDPRDPMTGSYVQLYGEVQRQRTLGWFRQALEALS